MVNTPRCATDVRSKLCDAGPHNCRSYGAVYRAERRADDTEVAVKIIPADNPVDLLKEVDIMMACTSPYIVRLHDCFYKVSQIQIDPSCRQQCRRWPTYTAAACVRLPIVVFT